MSIFLRIREVKPYSLIDYRREAEQLIIERIDYIQRVNNTPLPSVERAQSYKRETGKPLMFEPAYGAKWSALTRKRKSGLLLLWLYYIAEQERLDMTMVLAQRLLEGVAGCSISNRVLKEAFSRSGRTAADKSQDWDQVDRIIQKYKPRVEKSLLRNQNKLADIKTKLWDSLNKG